jgi:hypothetical protein
MAAAVLSFNRAKVIQALLDSTIGELPEVRELQWDELMPFERAELDKQKACANIRTCARLAKNPDTFALKGIGERAPAQAAPVGF